MISVIAVLVAVGVVAISIFMCCSSSSKSERTSQSSSSPENAATKRVNPDPHEALANSREIKGGSLSARAHELKVMLGLPEKNGQVTVAVDMERIYDPCYKGMDEALSALCEFCIVFLLIKSVTDKEEDHQTKEILAHLPSCPIPIHRVLHYETIVGKTAFVRQLKPYLHIENDEAMFNTLRPHVPLIVFHQCAKDVDLLQKPFPHQIESYDDLKSVELKI